MEESSKGTVTSLSSLFPAKEAQKASQLVQDTISERQKQLEQLRHFAADNTSLINFVQRLPDQLHHDIMVPFGKAAFFPGRLVHTNEFMVLLGEGYYAERTSKQTVEILKRRGNSLDSQIESLKAVMQDLKAEASFFHSTANEAAEGLVEIREEYVEDTASSEASKAGMTNADSPNFQEAGNAEGAVEDDEYARISSVMDALEKEEEAENENRSDEDEENTDDIDNTTNQNPVIREVRSTEVNHPSSSSKREVSRKLSNDLSSGQPHERKPLSLVPSKVQPPTEAFRKVSLVEKDPKVPETKDDQTPVMARNEAFIGTIIERTHNIGTSTENSASQGKKPVSRFKMQRK